MPTGYTAIIEEKEDLTFEEFALRCARNFGALIQMRDDSLDAEVPDQFPLDDYHGRSLEDEAKKLLDIKGMTHKDIERRVETKAWYDKKQYDEALVKFEKYNAAYSRMLAKVEAWTPPSAAHHSMKRFMIEQIKVSLPNHPSEYYGVPFEDPKQALVGLDHEAWRRKELEQVLESMEYHQKNRKEDVERNNECNVWLKKLKASIKDL
jgi:hypothetical protein